MFRPQPRFLDTRPRDLRIARTGEIVLTFGPSLPISITERLSFSPRPWRAWKPFSGDRVDRETPTNHGTRFGLEPLACLVALDGAKPAGRRHPDPW